MDQPISFVWHSPKLPAFSQLIDYMLSRQNPYGGKDLETENSCDDSLFVIQLILKNTDPNQFWERDSQGCPPSNILVKSHFLPLWSHSEKVIIILVKMHHQEASATNPIGHLPIHQAIENG
jgi:hypothetical protein